MLNEADGNEIVFFISQVLVASMLSQGFFSANALRRRKMESGSWIGHLVNGAISGAVAYICSSSTPPGGGNGIKFSVGAREALECGVKAKALQRLPLIS